MSTATFFWFAGFLLAQGALIGFWLAAFAINIRKRLLRARLDVPRRWLMTETDRLRAAPDASVDDWLALCHQYGRLRQHHSREAP